MGEFVKRCKTVNAVQIEIDDTELLTLIRSGFKRFPILVVLHTAFGDVEDFMMDEYELRDTYDLDEISMNFIRQELGL